MRVPRPGPNTLDQLADLAQLFSQQPARIDCQVETHWGAVALAELVGGGRDILVRTGAGPQLLSRAVTMS
ncbi:hypothetical protein BH09ACT7_BH09ACT7_61500 [soil metagenome]